MDGPKELVDRKDRATLRSTRTRASPRPSSPAKLAGLTATCGLNGASCSTCEAPESFLCKLLPSARQAGRRLAYVRARTCPSLPFHHLDTGVAAWRCPSRLCTSEELKLIIMCCFVSLPSAEDSLNIALREVTVTARDGRVSQLDQVYIRGSMARFFIVPDMLANAPMYVQPFHTARCRDRTRVEAGLSSDASGCGSRREGAS